MIHRHSGKFPLESVLRVGEEFSVKNVSTRRESQGLLLATAVWGKRGTAARPRVVGGAREQPVLTKLPGTWQYRCTGRVLRKRPIRTAG